MPPGPTILNPLPFIHIMQAFLVKKSSSLKSLFRSDELCALETFERLPLLSQLLLSLLWYQTTRERQSSYLYLLACVSMVEEGHQGYEENTEVLLSKPHVGRLCSSQWLKRLVDQDFVVVQDGGNPSSIILEERVKGALDKMVVLFSSFPYDDPMPLASMCLGAIPLPTHAKLEERAEWSLECFPTDKKLQQLMHARAWRKECGEDGGDKMHCRILCYHDGSCGWRVKGEGLVQCHDPHSG